jgi:hypothetical protein
MSWSAWVKGGLVAVCLAPTAWAFCGFYVAQEQGSLFNKSSKVVLVREGDHTVLTMANDFRGNLKNFGLVVPVPQEITPGMVKVAERAILDKLDQYTVPRLVEYHDPDPCPPPYDEERDYVKMSRQLEMVPMAAGAGAPEGRHGVKVEQSYSLEEYDIVVVNAKTGAGLERWLREEGYQVPAGSTEILESYTRQNMHFFLAKIDLAASDQLGVRWPRPLRVEYDSPKFMLPIRLGTVNADGYQDLLVYALTPKGRVETTNYRTAKVPTDFDVPEGVQTQNKFAAFYTSLFDQQVLRDGMSAVYTEYAWPLSVQCDPCTAEQLTASELVALGASWASDYHGGVDGGFVTRLHVRYDRAHFPEDLAFQTTADTSTYQARYVVHHPWRGDTSCAAGKAYRAELVKRQAKEVANLAEYTGWDLDTVRALTEE